jgi:hypothetical protein
VRLKEYIFTIILITISAIAGNSQDVTVTASFDTSRIYIGDQINYTIKAEQPSDVKLSIPVLKDTLFKSIEILAGPVTDTQKLDNKRLIISDIYLVTSFDSGFYQVPPAYAEIVTESGMKRFYSDYSPLEVMRVNIAPADTTSQIFDIIGPYKAPVTFGEILPWLLLAALAAVLIWVMMRVMRRLKKTKPGYEPVIVKEPAHVIAFRDLEKLKEQKLWQKGEIKLYYSRLTEIIRQYLENRYGVYSLEMTTSETLDELVKTGFRKDATYMKLKSILNGSDLVKFAKYRPDPSENELHFENSWEFVDFTKLREEPQVQSVDSSSKENRR